MDLTDIGIATLKDRYLTGNETEPAQAFRRAAEAFSDDQEHADRVYSYVSKLWFMFSTPILSNAPVRKAWAETWEDNFKPEMYETAPRGMPISCITGDSPVITSYGAKPAEDIKVGDRVLTHKGRFRGVVGVKKSLSSDTYRLRVNKRRTPIIITGNHLVLTNYGWVRVDELNPVKHHIASNTTVDVEENTHSISIQGKQTPYAQFKRKDITVKVDVTSDLMWALGFWFAEGCTSDNGSVRVTHGEKEPCEKWGVIMDNHFNTGFTINSPKGRSWSTGEVYSKTLQEWFDGEFGKGCKSKILTEWLVNSPKEQLESFMEGFYLGDGFKTTKNKAFELANPELVAGLHLILLRLGVRHSMNLGKKTKYTTNGIICYDEDSLRSDRHINSVGRGFECNGLIYNSIRSLEFLGEEELVYDLQVEEDESFSVAGFIVHNCFLNYIPDSLKGIGDHYIENMYLASGGGGIGGHWSSLRSDGVSTSKGSASNGIMPFIKVVDSEMSAVSQGKTRRGSYAAYLDINHPEIQEFISMRKPTGGDLNRKSLNLHHGVNITDDFMSLIDSCEQDPNMDDSWELIDPHSKEVVSVVSARALWQLLLETRMQTGEPYVAYIDTINRYLPEAQRERGLKVRGSNLCAEITEVTDPNRTAICCLSSPNLAKWDEWKDDPLFIPDLIRFLDNVIQFYIDNCPEEAWRARNSAALERSLGLGAMGFHTLLMQKGIPFESALATSLNRRIFAHLKESSVMASRTLAEERGEPEDMKGTGRRNAHLMAVAPNASSSLICGSVSPSVEPLRANAFAQKTLSGTFTIKNRVLQKVLEGYVGFDEKAALPGWLEKQWRSIIRNKGSVQHLPYLSKDEKEVFKTAMEMDQRWIVDHAADRAPLICQSQSINLFLPPDVSVVELHGLHMRAWKKGLKTLYYVRSESVKRTEDVSVHIERKDLFAFNEQSCLSCEG